MRVANSLLTWSFTSEADENAKTAAELTRGKLVLQVGNTPVWNFSWTWIELLEWLAQNWTELISNESQLALSQSGIDTASWEFLSAHDLGASIQGASLPMIVIWRDEESVHIDTPDSHAEGSWQPIEDSLWTLGEHIASYLNEDDERGAIALRNWEAVAGRS